MRRNSRDSATAGLGPTGAGGFSLTPKAARIGASRLEEETRPGRAKERTMPISRLLRVALFALMLAPALAAQAPSSSEPVRYMLPPKNIVVVFDAESLPGATLSPN